MSIKEPKNITYGGIICNEPSEKTKTYFSTEELLGIYNSPFGVNLFEFDSAEENNNEQRISLRQFHGIKKTG